eukprot:UN24423
MRINSGVLIIFSIINVMNVQSVCDNCICATDEIAISNENCTECICEEIDCQINVDSIQSYPTTLGCGWKDNGTITWNNAQGELNIRLRSLTDVFTRLHVHSISPDTDIIVNNRNIKIGSEIIDVSRLPILNYGEELEFKIITRKPQHVLMNFELKQKDRPSQVNTVLTKPKPYPVFNLMTNDMRTDLSNCVEDDVCVSDVPHIMDIIQH